MHDGIKETASGRALQDIFSVVCECEGYVGMRKGAVCDDIDDVR